MEIPYVCESRVSDGLRTSSAVPVEQGAVAHTQAHAWADGAAWLSHLVYRVPVSATQPLSVAPRPRWGMGPLPPCAVDTSGVYTYLGCADRPSFE